MRNILDKTEEADSICKNIYGYQIPWLVHAAAQQIRQMGYEEISNTLANVAIMVELGVPNEAAAWIFLAGVRSRAASTELAQCGVDLGESPSTVRRSLRDKDILGVLKSCVSDETQVWLDLHWSISVSEKTDLPKFSPFTAHDLEDQDTLHVRTHKGRTYLCSSDARQRMAVKVTKKLPFDQVADDFRFSFLNCEGRFQLFIRSPKDNECDYEV